MLKLKMCCPNCNANLSVSMHQKGRNLKCPFCKKPFLFNDQIIEALLPQALRKLKTEWLVKRLLPEIVKSSRFKPELLQDLQTATGSNALLGLPYTLLTKKENGIVLNGEIRYWRSPLLYVGRNYYYLCNTWSNFSRGLLIAWAREMEVLLLKRPRVYKGGVDETKPGSYIRRLGRIQYSQDLCATQFCAHTALRTLLKTSPGATRNEIDKVLIFHGHTEDDIRQAFSNAKDLFSVSGKYYFREPAPKKHHNRWYGVLTVKTSRAVVDFISYYEGLSEEEIISALSEYGHRTNAIKCALNQPNQIVKINGCYYKQQIQAVKKQESKKVSKANVDLSQTLKNKSIDVVENEEAETPLKAHEQPPTSPTQQITKKKKKKRKIKKVQNDASILGHHQNHLWQAASQPKYVIVNGIIERVKSAVTDGEIMHSSSDSEDTWSGMGYLARDNGRFGSICGEDYAD